MKFGDIFAVAAGVLIAFAALARGAHDLWAASSTYLALLAVVVALAWSQYRRKTAVSVRPLALFFLFLIPFFISFYQSVNPSESYLELADWIAAILFFGIAINSFQEQRSINVVLMIVIPVFWIQALLCARQFVGGHGGEQFGTLINGNVMVCFLLPWIPVLLHYYLKTRRLFVLSGLIAVVVSFAMAISTWGWICLLVLLPLYWIRPLIDITKRYPWIVGGAGTLLIVVLGFVVWEKLTMVYTGTYSEMRNPTERLTWWRSAAMMLKDRPWWGIGIGNFPSAYLAYRFGSIQHTLYAHSFIATLLAEAGMMGLVGVLAALFFWAKTVFVNFKEIEPRWPFVVGVLLMLMFCTINLGLEILVNLLVLFFFMGVSVAPVVRKQMTWRLSSVIVVTTLGLAVLPYVLSSFLASQNVGYANQLISQRHFQKAEKVLTDALKLDPLSYQAERGLAQVAALQGQTTDSVTHQQRAIALNQLNGTLYQEWATYLEQGGDAQAAQNARARAQKLKNGFNVGPSSPLSAPPIFGQSSR